MCSVSANQFKRYIQNKNKIQIVISYLFLFKAKLFFVLFNEHALSFLIYSSVENKAEIHLLLFYFTYFWENLIVAADESPLPETQPWGTSII